MTYIRPIDVNTQGIGSAVNFSSKSKADKKEAKEPEIGAAGSEKAPVSADKVLDFMAQSAASVTPKTVDPSKYVDEESSKRIASFMASFEDKVAEGLKAFDEEFAGANISEAAKMAVVLKQVNDEA
ncbi:MAG: hypothetical protein WCY19_08550 [Candidatus Gastranaerophilaceae bacterium]